MVKQLSRILYVPMCVVLMIQAAGCGTLMYPERRGQKSGRIDSGVAIMDGLLLLLFIVPGVIAYVVDFSNGTIYLPGTARASLDPGKIRQAKFDPKHYTNATIEKIIKDETGYSVKLDEPNVKICRLRSVNEVKTRLAEVLPEINRDRVALALQNTEGGSA